MEKAKISTETEALVGSPRTLRALAKGLRDLGQNYSIERCTWKNFNSDWKGYRGLLLRVSKQAHYSLYA